MTKNMGHKPRRLNPGQQSTILIGKQPRHPPSRILGWKRQLERGARRCRGQRTRFEKCRCHPPRGAAARAEDHLDFAALAANPHGGFGPNLFRVWRAVWDARLATATAAGLPTRPIASLERRCLERLSATFARNLHLSIYQRTTNRYAANPAQPPDTDGDAHRPADL